MDEGEESADEAIVIGLKTRGRYRTMSRPEIRTTRSTESTGEKKGRTHTQTKNNEKKEK